MKAIDKDICARHPAMYAWIMRSGIAMNMTSESLNRAGIPKGDSIANQRLNALTYAYGYGENTTQFLRDTVLGRLDNGFKGYEVAYNKLNLIAISNGGIERSWKYKAVGDYSGSDDFEQSFREPKWNWRRNARHKTYAAKGRLGHGKRKRPTVKEISPGKLPARRDKVRIRRKSNTRRRSHKARI